MKSRADRLFVFVVSLVIVFGIAYLGSLFTAPGVQSEWYQSVRPQITPPDAVFPIIWNILFFLIALSLTFSWIFAHNSGKKSKVALLYGVNLALNLLWSILYFKFQSPILATIDIFALLISIYGIMRFNWRISKISTWLLIPYFFWVLFAAILTILSI